MVPTSDLSHNAKRQSYQDIGSNVLEADVMARQSRDERTPRAAMTSLEAGSIWQR